MGELSGCKGSHARLNQFCFPSLWEQLECMTFSSTWRLKCPIANNCWLGQGADFVRYATHRTINFD